MQIVNDHDIVAIGEATHGQLKLNKFRNTMTKIMITKCGFNVVVIEEQYSCAQILDGYIKNDDVDISNGLDAFPYLNTEFVALLEFLKRYNVKHNNCVSILGIDCQHVCPIYDSNSEMNTYVNRVIEKYDELTDTKDKANYRDKCMFDIFMRLYDREKKYVIFAHNGHIQKTPYNLNDTIKWFGNHMSEHFKRQYLSIGNTFYNGSYLAKDVDNDYRPGISHVNVAKQLENGVYYVDNMRDIVVYEGSVVYSSRNENEYFYETRLNNRFDILLVINNELPFQLV